MVDALALSLAICGPLYVAVFPHRTLLRITGVLEVSLLIPPPTPAVFSLKVVLVRIGLALKLYIPPPS